MRNFFEDYQRETQGGGRQRDRPALIRRGFGAAVWSVFTKLLIAVSFAAATALSGAGLAALLHEPSRDMLFELAVNTFWGR